jgi:hypothetical protein
LGRQLISDNLQISTITISNVQTWLKIHALAMNARPDILIYQGESVGGHETARESRVEQNLGRLKWVPDMSGIRTSVSGTNLFLFDFMFIGFPVKSSYYHWIRRAGN